MIFVLDTYIDKWNIIAKYYNILPIPVVKIIFR